MVCGFVVCGFVVCDFGLVGVGAGVWSVCEGQG